MTGVKKATTFSYTVKTIPPLKTSLPSLMVLPRQKPRTPRVENTSRIALTVLTLVAPCDLVLIVSSGWVAYTVRTPAIAPVEKVVKLLSGRLWRFADSLNTLYEPIRTADVADCFITVGRRPRYRPATPCSRMMVLKAWAPPLNLLSPPLASSILLPSVSSFSGVVSSDLHCCLDTLGRCHCYYRFDTTGQHSSQ
jgi:hypothetical protein